MNTKFHDGAAHVILMLDLFILLGPNGKHLCLVFEVLGSTIADRLEFTSEYWTSTPRGSISSRFPLWMSKRILRHVLLGISYLHANHVIHEDIHCDKLLFVPPNLDLANTDHLANSDHLAADEAEGNFPVKRLDVKIDMLASRYIATATPPLNKANKGSDLIVQISDLGSGESSARLGVIDKMSLTIA